MSLKTSKVLFSILLIATMFSLWAGFALLVVNQFLYDHFLGYTVGSFCIWELVAFSISILLTRLIIKKWGNIQFSQVNGKKSIVMDIKYGIYFGIYFLIAIIVGFWQFYVFSQKF